MPKNKPAVNRPPLDEVPGKSPTDWAKFWRVNLRTVQRWQKKEGMPHPTNIDGMIRWSAGADKMPAAFVRRIVELRAERAGQDPSKPAGAYTDPDWIEFEKTGTAVVADGEAQQTLERFRDFYAFKLRKANAKSDENEIRAYSDLVIKHEKAIRDNALAAKRLGVDVGELLPRPEVERIIFALAYWMMRAADLHIDALTGTITSMAQGLDRDKVRAALDGELLSTRMLIPFARAARLRAGIGLPDWAVAKFKDTAGDYLENGSELFEQEFTTWNTKDKP